MFPNEALVNIVDVLLASPDLELTYRLFKNNATIDADTELADLTESDFTGYAPKNAVTEAGSTINGSDEAVSLGATLTWTCTVDGAAQQAFGLYCTIKDAGGTPVLFFAWKFAAPSTIAFVGDKCQKKVDWYAKDYPP